MRGDRSIRGKVTIITDKACGCIFFRNRGLWAFEKWIFFSKIHFKEV